MKKEDALNNTKTGNQIERVGEVIQSELILPLSDEESTRKLALENKVDKAQEEIENAKEKIIAEVNKAISAEKVMMRALAEIRRDKLFRETHKYFREYAVERFGIKNGQYALNLAQAGDYLSIFSETFEDADALSYRTIKSLLVETNKIAEQIGVGKSEFLLMNPIIESVAIILNDASTKKKDGKPNIKPPILEQVNEMVAKIVKDGTVTIDGVQMKVSEAKEQVMSDNSLQKEIISQMAEQILAKSEIIQNETKINLESTNKPIQIEVEEFEEVYSEGKKDTEIAEVRVAEYLRAMKNIANVQTVGIKNRGWDIEATFDNGRKIYVEVKSVKSFNERFRITEREYNKASFYKNDYYIAVIINSEKSQIKFISDIHNKMKPDEVIQTVYYQFNNYSNHLEEEI